MKISSIGMRINDLIIENNTTANYVADKLDISKATMSDIINDVDKGYNYKYFVKLADYFNVSTDYILGVTDVATTDKDLKFVCDYTGLKEVAINSLHNIKKYKNSDCEILIEQEQIPHIKASLNFYYVAISELICELDFTKKICELYNTMGEYIFAEKNDEDFEFCKLSYTDRLDLKFYKLFNTFNEIVKTKFVKVFNEEFYYEYEQNQIDEIKNIDYINNNINNLTDPFDNSKYNIINFTKKRINKELTKRKNKKLAKSEQRENDEKAI